MKKYLILALKAIFVCTLSIILVFIGILLGMFGVYFIEETGIWGFVPLGLWILLAGMLMIDIRDYL